MTSQAVQTLTQWWIDNRIDNLLPLDFEPDLSVVLANIKAGYTELYARLPSRLRQDDQIVSSVSEKAPDQLASVDVLLSSPTCTAPCQAGSWQRAAYWPFAAELVVCAAGSAAGRQGV
jgi:hypothetical protein